MNNRLIYIEKLLNDYSQLKYKKWRMDNSEYRCTNWEDYKKDYENVINDMKFTLKKLERVLNNYIDYPIKKFFLFDATKKVKIKKSEGIFKGMIMITIPYIDKREYYCIIHLFEKSKDIMGRWDSGKYYFK